MSDNKLVPAGDLTPGMIVKTMHEKTLEFGQYKVSHVEIIKSERLKIIFDHIEFICSPSHKFYKSELEDPWIKASDLKIGEIIGNHYIIGLEEYEYGDVVKITVDDAHTYICEDLLSHNKTFSFLSNNTPDFLEQLSKVKNPWKFIP